MVRSLEALKFWVSDQSRHQTQVVTRPKSSTDPKSSPSPSRHLTQVIDPSRRPKLLTQVVTWPKSLTKVIDPSRRLRLSPDPSCRLKSFPLRFLFLTILFFSRFRHYHLYDCLRFFRVSNFFLFFFSFLRTLWLVDGESYNRKIVRKSTPLFFH